MATTTPAMYNVYKVWFDQGLESPPHLAIVVVQAHQKPQERGRIYQVIHHPAIGMEYNMRLEYNFLQSKSFKEMEFQFQIPMAFLETFDKIAQNCPPPYDPNAPLKWDPKNNVRNCVHWIEEVLQEVRKVLQLRRQQAGHQQGGNRRGSTQPGDNSTS